MDTQHTKAPARTKDHGGAKLELIEKVTIRLVILKVTPIKVTVALSNDHIIKVLKHLL